MSCLEKYIDHPNADPVRLLQLLQLQVAFIIGSLATVIVQRWQQHFAVRIIPHSH